jgi:phosphatidylglycerophosphatase A
VLGTGYFPYAPGTVGSLVSALTVYLLSSLPGGRMLTLALLPAVITVGFFGSMAGHRMWGGDPSRVTVDEFAGCWLACLASPPEWGAAGFAAAFALFRLFDILKPWPVCRFDSMEGPAGILLDDLAAGVMAGFPLLAFRLLHHG